MPAKSRASRALAHISTIACVCLVGGEARAADIHELAQRVTEDWKSAATRVEALPPRFLFDDESVKLVVPPAQGSECVTIGIIGARGMSFHVKVAGVVEDPLDETFDVRASSVAGVLQLSRCKKPMDRIVLSNDAGRGAVEILVGYGHAALPPLSSVLLERTGGTSMLPPETAPAPPLPPSEERAKRADARAIAESATAGPHLLGQAEADGTGAIAIDLEPACHAIDVFAETGRRTRRLDLDADVRDAEGTVLARDRTEAADAHLFLCVGEPMQGEVTFVGAPPRAKVVVAHSIWPISQMLPELWGATPRARMAAAMRSRHLPPPPDRPIFLAQGASGETALSAPVLPASCYVAVAAVTSGHARGIGIRAIVSRTEANDDRAPGDDGGAVAFCTTTERTVRIGVDARGAGVMWGLAVFRVLVRKATP